MAFQTRIRVRFGDEDHAGIVYFPRFFDFFHCAFEDFFNENGMPYQEVLDHDHTGWPTVHVECDFRQPLRFGDILVVDVWVERVGERSATFGYRGRRAGREDEVAQCRIVHACIDMKTFTSKPIPQRYRELFSRFSDPPE